VDGDTCEVTVYIGGVPLYSERLTINKPIRVRASSDKLPTAKGLSLDVAVGLAK
jgi:hypothetical protein